MVLALSDTTVALLAVAGLLYLLVTLVPRLDEQEASYRKFVGLTALGIGYLVGILLLLATLSQGTADAGETVLGIVVASVAILGLALLGDVFDDWVRLFADPEFNTLVEASLVVAVLVVLAVVGLLPP